MRRVFSDCACGGAYAEVGGRAFLGGGALLCVARPLATSDPPTPPPFLFSSRGSQVAPQSASGAQGPQASNVEPPIIVSAGGGQGRAGEGVGGQGRAHIDPPHLTQRLPHLAPPTPTRTPYAPPRSTPSLLLSTPPYPSLRPPYAHLRPPLPPPCPLLTRRR